MAETDKPADKPTDAKPIVDVAHPGQSAPSDNSKSVIVSNRPLLKDPMVMADNAAKMPDREPAKNSPAKIKGPDMPSSQSATAPLLETEAPDETAEQTAEPELKPEPESKLKPKPEKVVKPSPAAPSAVEPDADQPAKSEDDDSDKSETAAADEEGQAPAKGSPQQLEAETAAEAKHQAAIAKLADSKQYYLPINTVEKRRSRRFIAIGVILSLLLVAAWADIALDAGLIKIHGIKPLTHLFSS